MELPAPYGHIRRTSKFLVGHTDTVLTVAMKGNIDAWLFLLKVVVVEVTWKHLRVMMYMFVCYKVNFGFLP